MINNIISCFLDSLFSFWFSVYRINKHVLWFVENHSLPICSDKVVLEHVSGWLESVGPLEGFSQERGGCLEGSSLMKRVDVWEGLSDLRGREERMKTYFLVYGERIIYPLLHSDDSFLHK